MALPGTSPILKIDSEGRIVLTKTVKAYAHIGTEAVFVGQGRELGLWGPGLFRQHLDEARALVRELRGASGSSSAAVKPRAQGARE